ncbi:MAG: hypothetical protein ACYCST_10415 [Acidimicrobiales bacterium]
MTDGAKGEVTGGVTDGAKGEVTGGVTDGATGSPGTGPGTVEPHLAATFGVPRMGTVVAYDSGRGLGSIGAEPVRGSAPALYSFHCTAIADGSRDIAVGAPVLFLLFPGLGGTLEAGRIIGLPADDPD